MCYRDVTVSEYFASQFNSYVIFRLSVIIIKIIIMTTFIMRLSYK